MSDRITEHAAGQTDDGIKREVQRRFGQTAANYTASAVHAAGADLARIAGEAVRTRCERVLDVGCGAGHTALAAAEAGAARVVALDFTRPMLAQVQANAAARGLERVVAVQGDAERLPFPDALFDTITSRYSAHHYPHPARAVREMARVLKPGGRLLLSDIVAPETALSDTFLQTVEYLRDGSHVRDHRASEWLAMLGMSGLSASILMRWRLPLAFDAWVERIATPPPQVAMLRVLFREAAPELRTAFGVETDAAGEVVQFSIDGALFIANKP